MEHISNIAFVTIFLSALVDAFFLTGVIFYGALLIGAAGMLHATGQISTIGLFTAGYLGSTLGSMINFFIGRFFGNSRLVKKVSAGDKLETARRKLGESGLFFFMLVGKFVGVLRPIYAITLGVLHVNTKKFITFELILALFWTSFWTTVLIFGENIFNYIQN